MQKEPAALCATSSFYMEHETRFELAFPSRSADLSYSLIANRSQLPLTLARESEPEEDQ